VEPVAGHPDREALSDPQVLALGRSERRALVTNNLRDFRPLHHEAITPGGTGHFGAIFMPSAYRRTRADTGGIIAALEVILARYPGEEDLVDGEDRLWPGRGSAAATPVIQAARFARWS
jgi:hypothetical protein